MSRRSRPARSDRTRRLRDARKVERTPLGTAVGVVAILAAVAAYFTTTQAFTTVSIEELDIEFARSKLGMGLAVGASRTNLFLLTYVVTGALIAGAIGILLRQTWGWWLVLAGAVFGVFDLWRIYGRLFMSINPSHPRSDEAVGRIVEIVWAPALFYVAVIALLMQRSVRVGYHVSRGAGGLALAGDEPLEGPPEGHVD